MSRRSWIEACFDRGVAGASTQSRWQVWIAVSSLCILALALVTLFNGPTVVTGPTDVFVLLDGAGRLFSGQVAHADFSNPIGVLTYWLIATGMRLGGPELGGIARGAVVFLMIVGPWATWIGYSRLEPPLACAFVVFLALLCVATRPLGYPWYEHGYAMLYNRIGWTLLALVLVQALVPNRSRSGIAEAGDAASLGALLALLFFTKITFAIFGAAAIMLSLLLWFSLRRLALVLTGAAATVTIIVLAAPVSLVGYLHDIAGAGAVQSPEGRLKAILYTAWWSRLPLALLAATCFGMTFVAVRSAGRVTKDVLMATLVFCAVCIIGVVASAGNTGEGGQVPVYAIAALVLLHLHIATVPLVERRALVRLGGGAALLMMMLISGRDLANLADTAAWREYRLAGAPKEQRLDAERLADFVIPASSTHPTQYWRSGQMPAKINDGLALLRNHAKADNHLFVAATGNLFSFALGLPPSSGGPLWWDRGMSYALHRHPSAAEVFGGVDLVMIPLIGPKDAGCCKHVLTDIKTMYGDYLSEAFVEAGRSADWVLLARRGT